MSTPLAAPLDKRMDAVYRKCGLKKHGLFDAATFAEAGVPHTGLLGSVVYARLVHQGIDAEIAEKIALLLAGLPAGDTQIRRSNYGSWVQEARTNPGMIHVKSDKHPAANGCARVTVDEEMVRFDGGFVALEDGLLPNLDTSQTGWGIEERLKGYAELHSPQCDGQKTALIAATPGVPYAVYRPIVASLVAGGFSEAKLVVAPEEEGLFEWTHLLALEMSFDKPDADWEVLPAMVGVTAEGIIPPGVTDPVAVSEIEEVLRAEKKGETWDIDIYAMPEASMGDIATVLSSATRWEDGLPRFNVYFSDAFFADVPGVYKAKAKGILGLGGIGLTPGYGTTSDVTIIGALNRSSVEQVVATRQEERRSCYAPLLQDNPDLSGKVEVEFMVSAEGTVARSSVKSSTINDEEVEDCLARDFETLTFPEPRGGGVVIVSYTIVVEAPR
ncbi:MAG: energy transducer TonB [Proteobacteria bacterium]|nr:energy transducer TonB [Pseudomonadota bacterium]